MHSCQCYYWWGGPVFGIAETSSGTNLGSGRRVSEEETRWQIYSLTSNHLAGLTIIYIYVTYYEPPRAWSMPSGVLGNLYCSVKVLRLFCGPYYCWNILIVRVSSLWQCDTNRNKLLFTCLRLVVYFFIFRIQSFSWSAVHIIATTTSSHSLEASSVGALGWWKWCIRWDQMMPEGEVH